LVKGRQLGAELWHKVSQTVEKNDASATFTNEQTDFPKFRKKPRGGVLHVRIDGIHNKVSFN